MKQNKKVASPEEIEKEIIEQSKQILSLLSVASALLAQPDKKN